MAYNPNLYMPYGQQSFPQPIQQPGYGWQLNTEPYQQPFNGLISVTGLEGAKAYNLPPNSSVALFDNNEDILYVKTTDAGGFPTIKLFSFAPIEDEQPTQNAADMVSREEFDALLAKVDALQPKKQTNTTTRRAKENDQ